MNNTQSAASQTAQNEGILGPPPYERSDTFYFQDVVFLVENCLFRVPRRNFEGDSDIFRDMFSLPDQPVGAEGSSDDHPIRLEGVRKDEMTQLLRVMFPKHYGEVEDLTYNQWLSVLKLSDMWNFTNIGIGAAKALDTLLTDPVERIILAKKYRQLEHWLVPALNTLAQRDQPLYLEEAERLGLEMTLRLSRVRESDKWWNSNPQGWRSGSSCHCGAQRGRSPGHAAGCPSWHPERAGHDFAEEIREALDSSLKPVID